MDSTLTSSLVKWAARRLVEGDRAEWLSKDLPWRRNRTPYRIFLAELLLIRTHTTTVARLFEKIYDCYPNLPSLVNANEKELGSALEPLGLRKRVPLLIEAASFLVNYHNAKIPRQTEDLLKVPGLGPYTAAAIAAFAFNSSVVPADVNILRFVSRLTGIPMKYGTKASAGLEAVLPLLSRDKGGPTPEVLLDFSRKICRSRHPKCSDCPLAARCTYLKEAKITDSV